MSYLNFLFILLSKGFNPLGLGLFFTWKCQESSVFPEENPPDLDPQEVGVIKGLKFRKCFTFL